MGVELEVYRSRIGTFNPSRQYSCKTMCKKFDQERNRNYFHIRIRTLLVILQVFLLARQYESFSGVYSSSGVYSTRPIQGCIKFQNSGPPRNNLQWFSTSFLGTNSNFYARYTYGNRSTKGIKLSHWNAGSAFLENKMNDIENVIGNHHPHLLGISEANFHKNHCLDNCKIEGYELITSKTLNNMNLQVSRVVVYKHTSLVAKVREDLMSDKFSSIWLEVGFPGRKRFLVCNLYRDWQYLGQSDHSSLEMSEQLARWINFLEQWELALDTGKECIVMGDFNIDFLNFYRTDLPSSCQAYRLQPLVDELFSRIIPHGVKQCVVGATRQGGAGQADSGLDHLWTNILID